MTGHGRTETLVFGFDESTARLEGHLLGALEKAESGGAIRVIEVVVATLDRESGELEAIRLTGSRAGLVAAMTEFRLDAAGRRAHTEKALDDVDAETHDALRAAVPAGGAVAAVLLEHVWLSGVRTAVERSDGRTLADDVDDDGAPVDLFRRAAGSQA
jgi:hypothetical protein